MEERAFASLVFHTRSADSAHSAEIHEQKRKMIRWADHKLTECTVGEHHLSGDGFLATPLHNAAMVVGAADNLKAYCCCLLAPLYNPLFLAEQIAYLDLTSSGRVRSVLGMGYREAEYQAAGISWPERGAVMDRLFEQLLALLQGETVNLHGVEGTLQHLPKSPLEDIVFAGGNSKPAARRAARFGLGFAPALADPALEDIYLQACEEYGAQPRYRAPRFSGYVLLADNPDKAWEEIGSYLFYDAAAYQSIGTTHRRSWCETSAADIAALREQGSYKIFTPEQALEQFEETRSITLNPQVGGLPSSYGWRCLELFETQMLPHMTLDFASYPGLEQQYRAS
jgi:alkanesulfonate monooxygenase SsuD/methylene tetrahydromethanopterin reductase-like flavin-dependent oxidoreductase (luciferase family)